jgi:hypothetical protein
MGKAASRVKKNKQQITEVGYKEKGAIRERFFEQL